MPDLNAPLVPHPWHSRLTGKVVVVAGGAGGTGEATSRRLGSEGAIVIVGDIDLGRAERVAEEIREAGGTAVGVEFDMGDQASVSRLIHTAGERYGRLDGLHNIALDVSTMVGDGDVVSTSEATWDSQINHHLLAYAHACREAIPLMLETGGGSIINTSSAASRAAGRDRVAYQVVKSGIETLSRHIAQTFGKQGLRCNVICYGVILTETARAHLTPEFVNAALRNVWTPRLGKPEDIAGMAALLMSDDGEFINGQILDVNGGVLLGP